MKQSGLHFYQAWEQQIKSVQVTSNYEKADHAGVKFTYFICPASPTRHQLIISILSEPFSLAKAV